MRTPTPARSATGPFVLPARVVLAIAGALAVGLALFNLYHEYHGRQVDRLYAGVALALAAVWTAGVVAGFIGSRFGILVAGAIGFIQFCVVASNHFVIGPNDIDNFWKAEGLPVATGLMGLIATCVVLVIAAVVAWGTPRGRYPSLAMLPVLIVAVAGAFLVVLAATDAIHRADFGASNAEDSSFSAAVFAAGWVVGALWIPRVRRIGGVLIAVSTFGVWYSFITLHLLKGDIDFNAIRLHSGTVWAAIDAGAAVLAAASFLLSLAILAQSLIRRRAHASSAAQTVQRRA